MTSYRNSFNEIYTFGHSTHLSSKIFELLAFHKIEIVCDVRSQPYSKMSPQFNREALKRALADAGIAYVFLGRELGARSELPSCYVNGKVQYDRIAATELFQSGLNRVLDGAARHRIALMCAEKEPMECHRSILVARRLVERGAKVHHILEDGAIEDQDALMVRVMEKLKLPTYDMFKTEAELVGDAYRVQGERIAYQMEQAEPEDEFAAEGLP